MVERSLLSSFSSLGSPAAFRVLLDLQGFALGIHGANPSSTKTSQFNSHDDSDDLGTRVWGTFSLE